MNRPPILVIGGYGVFGWQVARQLAAWGLGVALAGRDPARAVRAARRLPGAHAGLEIDLDDRDSCHRALAGRRVAVNCAGPFSRLSAILLEECAATGVHHVDISEDRDWTARVRSHADRFGRAGLSAVHGCSSLPGISGALGLVAASGWSETPHHARVTLFIGNHNPKGGAALRSFVQGLGRPIVAPQGILTGFGGPESVRLPPPFGRVRVRDMESPEYDLFPALLGVRSVRVKIGFEFAPAGWAMALLGRLAPGRGEAALPLLAGCGDLFRAFGHSGGAVSTELFGPGGARRSATVWSHADGQRMAALPAALAARALAGGEPVRPGACTAYELLGPTRLVEELKGAGFRFARHGAPPARSGV